MNHIARYRNERALTQQELADQVGVSRRTLARWEAGTSKPQPKHLAALADALGRDIDSIEGRPITTLGAARRAAGYSQRAFAEQIDIPPSSLAAIETGRTPVEDPSRWARLLGRTTTEIERFASNAINTRYHILLDPPR